MSFFDIFKISQIKQESEQLKQQLSQISQENEHLKQQLSQQQAKIDSLGISSYEQTMSMIEEARSKIQEERNAADAHVTEQRNKVLDLTAKITQLSSAQEKINKQISSNEKKLSRCKELYKSVTYAIDNFFYKEIPYSECILPDSDLSDIELISPSVILKLHNMDVKSLRKAYLDNEKQIANLLSTYSARYTSKANRAIYNLMVIALRAEIQNILYNLKYEKLEKSIEDVKKVTAKYLKIAGDGNQSIASTLTKFIGEIEYLFINAVKIEYNYYVKREQAKQQQLALKEQMRQEAEERKALENEKKKIAKEEAKYHAEIEKIQEAITTSSDESELQKLQAKILELQNQLGNVVLEKERITNLQNGKAGTVYVISNLGSFGDHVFKIGMTRRLDPQDRVNELGNASVPFKYDVHSFIFSPDAVSLESQMHQRLNDRRVNKVNLRKEFFNVSMDELEKLVEEIDPAAEFNKTMLAEEFRQSISSEGNYTSDLSYEDDDDDE